MNFNFKNILSNIFGDREAISREANIASLKEAASLSSEKLRFLNDSKAELIKAFDSFNVKSDSELEKASQIEEKQSIQRRLDRYERNFLRDLKEINGEIEKATAENTAAISGLRGILTPKDADYEMFKAIDNTHTSQANHFAHLNFDTDVSKMSFDEVCVMLSKAIDQGILNNTDERPVLISDEDYQASIITLAKAHESGQLSEDQLEKGRRGIEGLTPVITTVIRDGVPHQQTIWKRIEPKAPEKAQRFLAQQNFEREMQVGDKITASFVGWSSGTEFKGAKVVIKEIHPDRIVAKFEEEYRSSTGYTYGPNASSEQGRQITLPRTTSDKWKSATSFEKWIDPETERRKRREAEAAKVARMAAIAAKDKERAKKTHIIGDTGQPGDQLVEIARHDMAQNGDVVEITVNNQLVRGVVRSIWRKDDVKGRLTIALEDGTTVYKQVPSTRGAAVMKVITGATVNPVAQEGEMRVKDPSRMDLNMLQELGRLGVSFAGVPSTELAAMTAESLSMRQALRDRIDAFNNTWPNVNLSKMLAGIKNEARAAGVIRIKTAVSYNIFSDEVYIEMTGSGGFRLERYFRKGLIDDSRSSKRHVYHAFFKSGTSAGQGTGLGKKIFRHLNEQYRRTGIDQLAVSANITSGAYAWGRYGFTADYDSVQKKVNDFRRAIGSTRTIALGDLPSDGTLTHTFTQDDYNKVKEAVDAFYAHNPKSTRMPMDIICQVNGSTPAKVLLNRNSWSGQIDLTDMEQRDRFESYIQY